MLVLSFLSADADGRDLLMVPRPIDVAVESWSMIEGWQTLAGAATGPQAIL